jgi:phosphoribosylformylglycinamidine cyclo-ligase
MRIAGITGERTLGAIPLEPTRIYAKPVLKLAEEFDIRGGAHYRWRTHGKYASHVPGALALIDARWARPAIFDWLQGAGNVAPAEMHRVFNCGIGMVLVVPSDAAPAVLARLAQMGETAMVIGAVEPRAADAPGTVVV